MKQVITTTAQAITLADVLALAGKFLTLALVYLAQRTAAAIRAAIRLVRAVRVWLTTSHNFTPGETDPAERVELTGWQYVGVALLTCAFALVVSIDWERMF